MKLCKNCINFNNGFPDSLPTCGRPVPSFVHGERALRTNPELERKYGECGEEGIYYQEIEIKKQQLDTSVLDIFREWFN